MTKRMITVFLATLFLSSAGIMAGTDACSQAVEICQKRISQIQATLTKVSENCANSGSEGCQNAVAELEAHLAAEKIECGEKIMEACQ